MKLQFVSFLIRIKLNRRKYKNRRFFIFVSNKLKHCRAEDMWHEISAHQAGNAGNAGSNGNAGNAATSKTSQSQFDPDWRCVRGRLENWMFHSLKNKKIHQLIIDQDHFNYIRRSMMSLLINQLISFNVSCDTKHQILNTLKWRYLMIRWVSARLVFLFQTFSDEQEVDFFEQEVDLFLTGRGNVESFSCWAWK